MVIMSCPSKCSNDQPDRATELENGLQAGCDAHHDGRFDGEPHFKLASNGWDLPT